VQRGGVRGHLLRHEAELDEGADVVGEQAVVNLIDVGKVVGGLAWLSFLRGLAWILRGGVGVVEADVVHEDAVKAHGVEVGDTLYGVEIFAIALAQGEDGSAGAEDLLPEMGKGSTGVLGVNGDDRIWGWRRSLRGKDRGYRCQYQSDYSGDARSHWCPFLRTRWIVEAAGGCRFGLKCTQCSSANGGLPPRQSVQSLHCR